MIFCNLVYDNLQYLKSSSYICTTIAYYKQLIIMSNVLKFERGMIDHLKESSKYYPVISLAGPRQAGKSTLLRMAFPDYPYVSMEEPDTALNVKTDPRGFFKKYDNGVIIDEAQKLPELFSYLQSIVDNDRRPGRFVLSGSQNYLMHRNITQSLAGRIDLSTLFPLDFSEINSIPDWNKNTYRTVINGFYPGKWSSDIPPKMFYSNYIKTYLERDVSDLVNVGNLTTFRTFLKLIAFKCGTQYKMTDLSNDLNISVNTVKSWISILESSYIIFLLPSYHRNFGKRLLKSSRLYFYDTGLLCHLLGLHTEESVGASDKYGMIFENLIIAEKYKYKAHRHEDPDMFFFRDSNGLEVDLIEVHNFHDIDMIEIKSGLTFRPEFITNMSKLKAFDPKMKMNIIYDGDETIKLRDYHLMNWRQLHEQRRAKSRVD